MHSSLLAIYGVIHTSETITWYQIPAFPALCLKFGCYIFLYFSYGTFQNPTRKAGKSALLYSLNTVISCISLHIQGKIPSKADSCTGMQQTVPCRGIKQHTVQQEEHLFVLELSSHWLGQGSGREGGWLKMKACTSALGGRNTSLLL